MYIPTYLSFSHQDSSDSNHPGDVLDHETFNEDFDNEMTLDQFMHHVESLGQHGTICDFHEFGLIFAGQMHCLPQRLKSTLFEIFSNGGCPKNFKQCWF